jgi:hypothetical protein
VAQHPAADITTGSERIIARGIIGTPDRSLLGDWKWHQVTEATASSTMESLV